MGNYLAVPNPEHTSTGPRVGNPHAAVFGIRSNWGAETDHENFFKEPNIFESTFEQTVGFLKFDDITFTDTATDAANVPSMTDGTLQCQDHLGDDNLQVAFVHSSIGVTETKPIGLVITAIDAVNVDGSPTNNIRRATESDALINESLYPDDTYGSDRFLNGHFGDAIFDFYYSETAVDDEVSAWPDTEFIIQWSATSYGWEDEPEFRYGTPSRSLRRRTASDLQYDNFCTGRRARTSDEPMWDCSTAVTTNMNGAVKYKILPSGTTNFGLSIDEQTHGLVVEGKTYVGPYYCNFVESSATGDGCGNHINDAIPERSRDLNPQNESVVLILDALPGQTVTTTVTMHHSGGGDHTMTATSAAFLNFDEFDFDDRRRDGLADEALASDPLIVALGKLAGSDESRTRGCRTRDCCRTRECCKKRRARGESCPFDGLEISVPQDQFPISIPPG